MKKPTLEQRIARLEKLVKSEGYTDRMEPDTFMAKQIVAAMLENKDVNPERLKLRDFRVMTSESQGNIIVYHGDEVDFEAPSVAGVIAKYRREGCDIKYRDFGDYLSMSVKTPSRVYSDPEFDGDFDRDEYMGMRRDAEWNRAQRDNHNWW